MLHLASGGRRSLKSGLQSYECASAFLRYTLLQVCRNEAEGTRWIRFDENDKFDHCGRHYGKHPNGEITNSMRAHTQNLEKMCMTRERMKHLDDELSPTESREFRGINGCFRWVTKELLYPFQFVVRVFQPRQGHAQV